MPPEEGFQAIFIHIYPAIKPQPFSVDFYSDSSPSQSTTFQKKKLQIPKLSHLQSHHPAMDSLTSLEVDEELRDLGHEAAWFLSSAKPGNGTSDHVAQKQPVKTWTITAVVILCDFFGFYMG